MKNFEPFKNKVYLSSPTMHGDEIKYITETYNTNWMQLCGNWRKTASFQRYNQDFLPQKRYIFQFIKNIGNHVRAMQRMRSKTDSDQETEAKSILQSILS